MRWLILASMLTAFPAWGERCRAVDGQTLLCGRERVLIEGLHAPDLKAAGGEAARSRLQWRIRMGEVIIKRGGQDKFGRTLGRLYVNGNRITQADVHRGR
jgi:endonuclease YncB( thermonuclease family)